jgi:hypothetical protein
VIVVDDIMKPRIELLEYNLLISLVDYFENYFKDVTSDGRTIEVAPSFFSRNLAYLNPPAMSIEIMYRKNRAIGFGNDIGDEDRGLNIIDVKGLLLEYRMQLNVYSKTGMDILKWTSLLDDALMKGDTPGIPINAYLANGSLKEANVGIISYNYATDVKTNPMPPNINTYDFHNIFEAKMNVIQKYDTFYEPMELGDIIGIIKSL